MLAIVEPIRAALLTYERAAAVALVQRYGAAYAAIEADLAALTAQIEAAGPAVTPSWVIEQEFYQRLLRNARQAFAPIGLAVEQSIAEQQRALRDLAQADARRLLRAGGLGEPFTLKPDEVTALAAADATQRATIALAQTLPEALVTNLKTSLNTIVLAAKATARHATRSLVTLRNGLGNVLNGLLGFHRTSVLASYRAATVAVYQANAPQVQAWQWCANLNGDPRPCVVCVAMHGSIEPMSTPLVAHRNCRCLALPVLTLAPQPVLDRGANWFAQQSPAIQRDILGAGKFRRYQAGELVLEDLIGTGMHPIYGAYRFERSLQELGAGARL